MHHYHLPLIFLRLVALSWQRPQPPLTNQKYPPRLGIDAPYLTYYQQQATPVHDQTAPDVRGSSSVAQQFDQNHIFGQYQASSEGENQTYEEPGQDIQRRIRLLGTKVLRAPRAELIRKALAKKGVIDATMIRAMTAEECQGVVEEIYHESERILKIVDILRYLHDYLKVSLDLIEDIDKARKKADNKRRYVAHLTSQGQDTVSYGYLTMKLPEDKVQTIEKELAERGIDYNFVKENVKVATNLVEYHISPFIFAAESLHPDPDRVRLLNRFLYQKWGVKSTKIKEMDKIRATRLGKSVQELCGGRPMYAVSDKWKYPTAFTPLQGYTGVGVDTGSASGSGLGSGLQYSSHNGAIPLAQYSDLPATSSPPWNEVCPSMKPLHPELNDGLYPYSQHDNYMETYPYGHTSQSIPSSENNPSFSAGSWTHMQPTPPVHLEQTYMSGNQNPFSGSFEQTDPSDFYQNSDWYNGYADQDYNFSHQGDHWR